MEMTPIHHPPHPEEISGRLSRLQAEMAAQGLDWYVSFQPDNVYYLTNFANFVHERPFVLLVPASGMPVFVVPKLEIPHVESRAIGALTLLDYVEFPAPEGGNWFDKLAEALGDGGRVGVESVCQMQILEAIRGERVRTDIIDDLRMVKTPYEIGRMLRAGQIASAAMADMLATATPGRSLGEVTAAANRLIYAAMVADNPSINPQATKLTSVFHPAQYSHDPHNFGDLDMRMQHGGPHVGIINAVMDGYGAEIERTFFLGEVPDAARKPYEVMMQARHLVFELVKPGVVMSEVDARVNALFRAAGYGQNLLHRAGHGMGVTAHEAPFLAEGDGRVLAAGMCFTVEPGIYFPGIGGFRHSDTILVTETGNLRLTDGPDSLEDMTL
ncbi:aminopeptidase P family protein [Yangia mangrovi]|uniref:Aminopeptidase P family protein n=1 Tax=Alloyangia mangrovi TaxID=1779329 RepID=A0A2A3JTK7_9RHOB|nr:Xaa-Pro peptidase family protein [Alloyangia mangrovi]MCT4368946.1 aminopeptidase P family protein [Alloyangia mangrovi]